MTMCSLLKWFVDIFNSYNEIKYVLNESAPAYLPTTENRQLFYSGIVIHINFLLLVSTLFINVLIFKCHIESEINLKETKKQSSQRENENADI